MSSTADVPSTSSDDCSRMNGTTGTIPNGLSVTDSVSQPPGPAIKSGDVDVNTDTCSGSNRIALVPFFTRSRRNAACTSPDAGSVRTHVDSGVPVVTAGLPFIVAHTVA